MADPISGATGWLVVGTGRHVERYGLPALARARSAAAVAVCGSSRERVDELASRHGLVAGIELESLLTSATVSHVYVCSRNDAHEEHVTKAAAAGKHVLCEKPLAPGTAAARRIVDACRNAGVLLGTGFHLRHNRALQEARRIVEDGRIGTPVRLHITYMHVIGATDDVTRLAASRSVRTPSKAVMAGTGAHAIDLARWLLNDDITDVSATLGEFAADEPHNPHWVVETVARTTRGVMVALTAGRARHPDNGVLLAGTRGRITVTGSVGHQGGGTIRILDDAGSECLDVPTHDVYADQFDDFVAATVGGGPASASGTDGLAALAVSEAVEQSLADPGGRRVAVDTPVPERVS